MRPNRRGLPFGRTLSTGRNHEQLWRPAYTRDRPRMHSLDAVVPETTEGTRHTFELTAAR